MSTDGPALGAPSTPTGDAAGSGTGSGTGSGAAEQHGTRTNVGWWHRDHPTFSALAGFFAGLLFICLVPTVFAGLVGAVAGASRVEDLLPFVLVSLAVPLVLSLLPRTRRFGLYMWVGILSTAVVVVGVGGLVLWYMVTYQS